MALAFAGALDVFAAAAVFLAEEALALVAVAGFAVAFAAGAVLAAAFGLAAAAGFAVSLAAGAFAFGAALPADAALLPDDFVPVVAPDLAGAFATAAFEAVGLGSGLSVAFAAGAFEEAAFGLLAALAGVVALGLAALVSVCFAGAGAALGLAAALGFAGDALPLPVAPVLAGSWAVAVADGVGSSIAFAAGAAFFLLSLLTVTCNLLSDLLYGITDPRVRLERGNR